MEKYKFQSKNEGTLIEMACKELGVESGEIYYKMSEEKGGLFSGKKFVLEVVKISEVSELGKQVLLQLLNALGMNAKIETLVADAQINYQIYSDNNSIIIGKRGHILESIQIFVRQAILNATDLFANINIDVEKYKEKQNYFLEKKVKEIAREVKRTKVDVKLDPMNSYDRKVVHSALQKFTNIITESVGEDPNRCIVIKYNEDK